jgi:hypothetical protein
VTILTDILATRHCAAVRSTGRLYISIAFASVALSPALSFADAETEARKKAANALLHEGEIALGRGFLADAVHAWRSALELDIKLIGLAL